MITRQNWLKFIYLSKMSRFLIFLFVFASSSVYSQTELIDSLRNETKGQEKKLITELIAYSYELYEIDKLEPILGEIELLSTEINYPKGTMMSSYRRAVYAEGENDFSDATARYLGVIKVAREIHDTIYLSVGLMGIGDIQFSLNEFENAIDYYYQVLPYTRTSYQKGLDQNYAQLATAYKSLGDLDSSMHYNLMALAVREENEDSVSIAYSFNNIALVYKDMGEYKRGQEYLEKSLRIKTRLGNLRGIASSNINLGQNHLLQGNNKRSYEYFLAGAKLADSAKILIYQVNAYAGLVRSAAMVHGFSEIQKYMNLYTKYDDSLSKIQQIESTRKIEAEFQLSEKEQEILIERAEKEKAEAIQLKTDEENTRLTNQIYYAAIGIVLLLVLVLIVVRSSMLRKRTNNLLSAQKNQIEEKNRDITDSINYAKKIQETMLPSDREMEALNDHFIFYRPKDIVSGDFYWISSKLNRTILAVGDCTGHGVPGAFMSTIGHNLLNQIVNDQKTNSPAQALSMINQKIIASFRAKSDGAALDGMDISLCVFDWKARELEYSGALRPLWLIREREIIILKGTKRAIGSLEGEEFFNQKIKFQKGDQIYLFSDGYPDQFGGEKGKKLKSSGFKKLLLSMKGKGGSDQKRILTDFIDQWQGKYEQLDDICIIGINL
ncbi:MAG: serine phosphatase RsbU (regulator of sigma subunit) [Parvicellaceae bacterium]|jgi:serine phosphatase RsbU (regulator of sigma subunit)